MSAKKSAGSSRQKAEGKTSEAHGGRGPTDLIFTPAQDEERRRQAMAAGADSPGKRGPTDISAENQRRMEEARLVDEATNASVPEAQLRKQAEAQPSVPYPGEPEAESRKEAARQASARAEAAQTMEDTAKASTPAAATGNGEAAKSTRSQRRAARKAKK